MRYASLLVLLLATVVGGCTAAGERNAFLTLAEVFGAPPASDDNGNQGGGGTGGFGETVFRRTMSVEFANNHATAELNTAFVAWVNTSSIRSADQQDALLRAGYVLIESEIRLGSVFTIPAGSFVLNGPGVAGATAIRLGPTQAASELPSSITLNIVTPDVLLAFSQPPVSCENVAFFFTRDGDPVTAEPVADAEAPFSGSNRDGPSKTLAQMNVYQCSPLRPGLFLKLGGGARLANEFFEGENVRFDFFEVPDANGDAGIVTISQ